jgi:hypothetical protein
MRDDEPGSNNDNYTSSSLDSSADGSDEHKLKSNTKLKSTSLRAARISGSSPGGRSECANKPSVVNNDQSRSSSVNDDLDSNADTPDSKREYELESSVHPKVAIDDGTSPSERVDRVDELGIPPTYAFAWHVSRSVGSFREGHLALRLSFNCA